MKCLEDCPNFYLLKHYGFKIDQEPILQLAFEGVGMVKVDLAATATLILGAHVPAFKERAPTATAWGIMLVMRAVAVASALCPSFVIAGMQAGLMGHRDVI